MEFTNWDTVLRGHDEIRAFLEVNPFTWMFHCLLPVRIEVAEDCRIGHGALVPVRGRHGA